MAEPSAASALLPGAKCRTHAQRPATGVCARCGDYLCGLCGARVGMRLHCTGCARRTIGEHSPRAVYALVIGLVLQLTLGVAAYVVRMSIAAGQSHQESLALLPTAHVAVGALILATSLSLTLVLSRGNAGRTAPVSWQGARLAQGEPR